MIAKPITLQAFLALLTPFTYYLRTGSQEHPKYTGIELALEHVEEEVLDKLVIVAWNDAGTIATIVHAPTSCGIGGSLDTCNDHAALNIVHEDALPVVQEAQEFTII